MTHEGAEDVRLTLDRETDLLLGAIRLVASGGARVRGGGRPATRRTGHGHRSPRRRCRRRQPSPAVAVGRGRLRRSRRPAGMTELAGGTGDPSTPRTSVSVLLVEDDDLLAGILARHLGAHGYQVTVAPTAEEALTAPRCGVASVHRAPGHQPAGGDRLVAHRQLVAGRRGRPARRRRERHGRLAGPTARRRRRRLPAEALPLETCSTRSSGWRDERHRPAGPRARARRRRVPALALLRAEEF